MSEWQERVSGERRRLKQVRQLLTAAVARTSGGDPRYVPFYLALADYIETAMARLHAQDVRMGDMIRARISPPDAEAMQALAELDDRLAGNQQHLGRFALARKALAVHGVGALGDFERVAADYTAYIVANMGHHGATTMLAQRLFSADDWQHMAATTDEDTRREALLHGRVEATRPPDLAP